MSYSGEDKIENCANFGAVTSTRSGTYGTGGLAGRLAGTITKSVNYGAVTSADRYTGGLAGYTTARNKTTVTLCRNEGSVSSSRTDERAATGSLVGYAQNLIWGGCEDAAGAEPIGKSGSVKETAVTGVIPTFTAGERPEDVPPPEEKTEVQRKNDRLLRTTALALCAALALSAFINRALVGFGDTRRLAEGTEFTDFDSFVRYMRKPVEPIYYGDAAPAPDTAVAESPLYYENDTPIYRSQTEGATIEDDNGNVLCNFIWRNRSVVFWRTGPKADGYLPVTVYTQEAMSLAQQKAKHINTVFYGVYAAEAVAALAIYLRKREK